MNTKNTRLTVATTGSRTTGRSSPVLNIGLIAIGAGWLAVLIHNGETRIERWLAASILALVGLTGILRIGIKRPGETAADPEAPASEG